MSQLAHIDEPRDAPRHINPVGWGRMPFRPDVEGLRGLAIALVVAFHMGAPGVTGGYVGVDVFLVISGYLITGMLLRDASDNGRLSIGRFYARRAKRVLPPAAFVVACVAAAQPFLMGSLTAYRSIFDYLFALLGVSNWWFALRPGGYLEGELDSSPVLHYWSLSVEQQVYVLWPLLLLPLAAWIGRQPHRGVWGARLVLVIVGSLSLAACVLLSARSAEWSYLATPTRIWQFALGGLVAAWVTGSTTPSKHGGLVALRYLIGWVGVFAIGYAAYMLTSQTVYPGAAAMIPTAGAAALMWAGAGHNAPTSASWVLSLGPLRALGVISYSLYLWHWPVLVFLRHHVEDPSMMLRSVAIGASILLACITYALIERPLGNQQVFRSAWVGATSALGALLAGMVVVLFSGLMTAEAVHADPDVQMVGQAPVTAPGVDALGEVTATPQPKATLPPSVLAGGPVVPQVVVAREDYPAGEECMLDDTSARPDTCVFGAAGGTPVALVGDSHMHQWQSALEAIAQREGWELHAFYLGGCPLAVIPPDWATPELDRFARPSCLEFRPQTIAAISELDPAFVITSALNRYTKDTEAMANAWRRALPQVLDDDTRLVYLHDTPWPDEDVPACLADNFDNWRACNFTPQPGAEPLPDMIADGEFGNAVSITMNDQICPDETSCRVVYDGILMYRDESHLTDTFVRRLAPIVEQRFGRAGLLSEFPQSPSDAAVTTPTWRSTTPAGSD